MPKDSIITSNKFLIPSLFVFALLMGLWNLNYSFSNDELSAVMRADFNSLSEIISQGVLIDFHPAGVQVFLTYWTNVFGNSEVAVRLPFVVFNSIAVVFAFITARKRLGLTPALLTAIAISVLQFSLMHAQLARPYSSGLMIIMIAFWLWDKIVFDKNLSSKQLLINSIALAVVFAASAYNHYFSALSAVIMALLGLIIIPKKRIPYYIGTGVLSAILFLPHIYITLYHLSKGSIGSWLAPPKANFLYTHILHIFNDSLLLFIVIALLIVIYAIIGVKNKANNILKYRIVLISLLLLPIIIGYAYSVLIGPVLQNRILLFNMPYLLMFMFSFVTDQKNRKLYIIPAIIAIAMFSHTVFINKYYSTQHSINFRSIAEQVQRNGNDLLRIQNSNSQKYLQYYLKDSSIQYSIYQLNSELSLYTLKTILDSSKAHNCEFVSLRPIDVVAKLMVESSFWNTKIDSIDYWQNGYSLFQKSDKWTFLNDKTNTLVNNDYSIDTMNIKLIEYSKGLEYISEDNEMVYLNIQMEYISDTDIKSANIVIDRKTNNRDKKWQGIPLNLFSKSDSKNYVKGRIRYNLQKNESINVYIWNPKQEDIKLINYELSISK